MSNSTDKDSRVKKHFTLYVLKLEQSKLYVGITTKTPQERFNEHRYNIRAAAWTRKYKPREIFDTKNLGLINEQRAKDLEDKTTLMYMKKYGVNNVRGGKYSILDEYKIFFGNIFTEEGWESIKMGMKLLSLVFFLAIALAFAYYKY